MPSPRGRWLGLTPTPRCGAPLLRASFLHVRLATSFAGGGSQTCTHSFSPLGLPDLDLAGQACPCERRPALPAARSTKRRDRADPHPRSQLCRVGHELIYVLVLRGHLAHATWRRDPLRDDAATKPVAKQSWPGGRQWRGLHTPTFEPASS